MGKKENFNQSVTIQRKTKENDGRTLALLHQSDNMRLRTDMNATAIRASLEDIQRNGTEETLPPIPFP